MELATESPALYLGKVTCAQPRIASKLLPSHSQVGKAKKLKLGQPDWLHTVFIDQAGNGGCPDGCVN